jgi:LytS/YehU family sensor histidine kinase
MALQTHNINITVNPWLVFTLALVIAAALVCRYAWKLRRALAQKRQVEEKYHELELKVNSLELENIKYKLNPHLFKNTLNAIQSHAYQTYYALDKLSNVLDFILYESDRHFVSLKEEIDFAMNLIEINRLKISPLFDLRLKNRIESSNPFYEQELIAPLITIDLIENAFKHADLQSEDAFISIVFELRDDVFSLTVSNKIHSRQAMRKKRSGFGKKNFETRLSILYKDNYKLERFTEGDIYISHLKINLLEHKAQMLAIG